MEPFENYRPKLFAVAYKMTKSVADAEDVVQDIFLRYASGAGGDIRNPEAYWVKAVMNRCLDLLEKKKHVIYPGIDLPEPLFAQRFDDAGGYDVSYALLVLLQKLNPVERAVFILRETLDYGYDEIAGILDLTEANCRQLLHRAKEKMSTGKVRNLPTAEERAALVKAFISGTEGDVDQLLAYLKEDIGIYSDGGGKVSAARNPIFGREACAAFLTGIYKKFGDAFSMESAPLNGETGVLLRQKETGAVDTAMLMDLEDGKVISIYIVRNPDKLKER